MGQRQFRIEYKAVIETDSRQNESTAQHCLCNGDFQRHRSRLATSTFLSARAQTLSVKQVLIGMRAVSDEDRLVLE